MRIRLKLSQFIAADLFLGYSIRNWDPRINYFLLGMRHRYNFFNLNLTYLFLKRAVFIINNVLLRNGVLWAVSENFSSINKLTSFYRFLNNDKFFKLRKWPNGLLTNYKNFEEFYTFPHAIFLLNLTLNAYAGNEATIIGVPVLSPVDSCENPRGAFYAIPSNSKSLSSTMFFLLLVFRLLVKNRIKTMQTFKFKGAAKVAGKPKFKVLDYLCRLNLIA